MTDSIVEAVIQKFRQRSELGQKKYGTTLDRTDLKTLDWIQHAQEEFMDGILYLEKLKASFQVTGLNEILDDDSSPPDSSDSGSEKSDIRPMRQTYTILCGKKRPRDDDTGGEPPPYKKRMCADLSVSTEARVTPAESVESPPSPCDDLKLRCAVQARACGEKF